MNSFSTVPLTTWTSLLPTLVKDPELHQHRQQAGDRKSTRLNSSHLGISYAVFCLKKKKKEKTKRHIKKRKKQITTSTSIEWFTDELNDRNAKPNWTPNKPPYTRQLPEPSPLDEPT